MHDDDGGDGPVVLPGAVRDRVLALAADRLGSLPPEEVPVGLRAFARFTPGKRARLAAVPIAASLELDVVFRQRVAEALRAGMPDLAAALDAGTDLPAAPPEDLAAAAYLLRPAGWHDRIRQVQAELAGRESTAAQAAQVDAVRQLTEQLAALREAARAEAARLASDVSFAQTEALAVRRKVRELGDRAGRAESAQRAAEQALLGEQTRLTVLHQQDQEQLRRLQARVADLEQTLAAGRQQAKDGRNAGDIRLRVLLDTLLGAASGLRRELALAPVDGRPADAVSADYLPAGPPAGPTLQGRDPDDPALLDALLCVPMTHLLVDGYNVTKGGYGEVTLEAQRARLLGGLGALAARTGAETTVVFDGADRVVTLAVPAPRNVRLLFSRTGETADDVLRRLVRAEPVGRPLVVVSSDREVADSVRTDGARPVPSAALLRLLARS